MKKIIFVGGGTLGHIYPMLPVVKKMKNEYMLYFIGTTKGLERDLIDKQDLFKECFYFDMQGFKRSLSLYNIKTLFKYFKSKKEINALLNKIKPDLLVGMGGYISGTVLSVGIKRGIKSVIHEQNAVMGLANRLVYKKVDKVLLSFPLVKEIKKKSILVGNPRISEIYAQNPLKQEDKKLIVSVGGSRGSKFINDTMIDAIGDFLSYGYNLALIVGNKYYQDNIEKIKSVINNRVEVIPFTNDLISYLKKARVVISRSGATTITELMALRKVCLLIPSPNVTSNHQEKNADILVNNKCCLKMLEKDITKENLVQKVVKLANDEDLRTTLTSNMIRISNYQSVDYFIEEIINLL